MTTQPAAPATYSPTAPPTALVPLVDGFETIEAMAVVDVLRRAGVQVTTAGVGSRRVTSSHGVVVEADALLSDALQQPWTAMVLPGGPGTPKLLEAPRLADALRQHHAKGRLLAAICAAPTVLAALGLLDGRRACCFPAAEPRMHGATLSHDRVVEDGTIITSRAAGTAVEFALAVAARLAGPDRAHQVAESILHVAPARS
jgi:4-methyl-5(b-hydroxyethyl)-thiazole monophosphate biosynthesis